MSPQTTLYDQPSMVAAQNTQRQSYVFDNREGGNAFVFEDFNVVCVYSVCMRHIGIDFECTCEVWYVWYAYIVCIVYMWCVHICM